MEEYEENLAFSMDDELEEEFIKVSREIRKIILKERYKNGKRINGYSVQWGSK